MTRRSIRHRRHLIHPSTNRNANNNTSSDQHPMSAEVPTTTANDPSRSPVIVPDNLPEASSVQPLSSTTDNRKANKDNQNITTNPIAANSLRIPTKHVPDRPSSSLFSKLTDAKKTLFGKNMTNNPFFSSTEENKALLNYVSSETSPKLDVIKEFEENGAQLNAITDEGNTILHLLARLDVHTVDCINIVDYLIRKGCDPNRQNDYGWTAAHYALAAQNTDLVVYLLKVMIDVSLPTFDAHNGYPRQTQLLHIAARKNNSFLIRLLIKTYRARVNIFDDDGCTPLHICCYENNIDALQILLENDADFQKGTRLNPQETPVNICVKYQHDQCLKLLFDLTTSFNWKRYFAQLPRSPLLCDFPSVYAIKLLVEFAVDIDACDERGNTFLHYLVNKKDVDYEKYIEILISASANFNRQNHLGRTPFLTALEQKNFKLIEAFFSYIELTNINVVDSLGNTALHYCKYLDKNSVFDAVLQSTPLALNAQNRDGQTPLHEAVLYDNYIFAQYLLQQNADLNLVNKDGNTPLHLAARDDNTKMCRLLMRYPQLDLIAVNKMGKTPLHLACAHEKPNVAAILINKMKIEQMNLLDIQGRTSLHECADNITGLLAEYLIRHGADGNAKDIRQNTPLHLATEKGNIELVRTLIQSSNVDINQLNADAQSPLALSILYNHDDVSLYLLNQEAVRVQATDLKMALQMNSYDMIKLLIEKDRNCLRIRSSTHGDMIIHVFMRRNFNNLIGLETLLSFISDNELLTYLSESTLAYGDNLLHIAARDDTPEGLTCFLNLSRVKFWFWANMMLSKNSENKTPMELANDFKHYSVIKLINFKWKESYEYLSHSLRDGHCGVSSTGVTTARRQCYNCNQTGFIESTSGHNIRPCTKCNVCLYKSQDNSMQIFLALLFSDESSTIALDIMDSLIVTNEVQKAIHLYLDHVEPWEEFDKIDLNDSSNLTQLVFGVNPRATIKRTHSKEASLTVSPEKINSNESPSSPTANKSLIAPTDVNIYAGSAGPSSTNMPSDKKVLPKYVSQSFGSIKYRPDGTCYRPITPLEAIYYHERLDLITHPLIKGLVKWKWDNCAAMHFYLRLLFELLFLILWSCIALIGPFAIRHVYKFPRDVWRCIIWACSIGVLICDVVFEMFDIKYARKRYEDYVIWETERKKNRLDLISKNKYKSNSPIQTNNSSIRKVDSNTKETEHLNIDETLAATATTTTELSSNLTKPTLRSHHSQYNPLPVAIPTMIKGKLTEPLPTQQPPLDAPSLHVSDTISSFDDHPKRRASPQDASDDLLTSIEKQNTPSSRLRRFIQRFRTQTKRRLKSYYMYYSLNNLFDWIAYICCILTTITHFIDVGSHTVLRARAHMYVASITVICIWFRFMVFFRTISISFKTLRGKLVEIKLGELVIMVRLMFDDIIRFLLVFSFLLLPYAFVFQSVFGGRHILQSDFEKSPELCENALLRCEITEVPVSFSIDPDSYADRSQFKFNATSSADEIFCSNATDSCRIIEPDGFETFYSLLFSIFLIALVDDIPIDSFKLVDNWFAAFVCGTYLLFTAILAVNIFIGLISNALQTEAFSTVEARYLLERIEVILNCEWRLSTAKRLRLQEMIHRQCAPLQLNWKDINFNAFGHTREEQQMKTFAQFRQTIDKHNVQLNTFRIQLQQKLNDIELLLAKAPPTTTPTQPGTVKENNLQKSKTNSQSSNKSSTDQNTSSLLEPITTEPTINLTDELLRLKKLIEQTLAGQTNRETTDDPTKPASASPAPVVNVQTPNNQPPDSSTHDVASAEVSQPHLNERIANLQLSINRLHQDVNTIRQVLDRSAASSTSLILGKTTRRK